MSQKSKIQTAIIILVILIGTGAVIYSSHHKKSSPQTSSVAPECSNPQIKGNISVSTGEKIYHEPGDRFYDATVIDKSQGERYFCTPAEAEAAGWRHSER